MTNDFSQYGLGRAALPDARDGLFGVRRIQQASARRGRRIHSFPFPPLNQGNEGTCVGFTMKDILLAGPIVQTSPTGDPTGRQLYAEACSDDEWPQNYDPATGVVDYQFGTSGRAGMEALRRRGYIGSYVHAQSIEEIGDFVLDQAPMAIGTNWHRDMFGNFAAGGFLKITGDVAGGHEYSFIGVDWDERWFELLNHWGAWGPFGNGRARLNFADAETLIFREGGDAIAGVEVVLSPAPSSALSFADAEKAAGDAYAAMSAGTPYNSTYYRKRGAQTIVDAIARRKAQA